MIPILFEKNAVDFSTNGLGRLIDCVSCKVTEERNGIYELEFVYPITGRFYQTMVDDGGTVCVWHNDQHDIQAFDIYAHSDPMDGQATFYAHHISYRLNRIIVGPFSATSPAEVMSKLSTESVNDNPFTFWTNKSGTSDFELSHPSDIRSLLFGQEGSILDTYGKGEYEFDMFNVKLYVNRGINTDVTIRYGKNLSDIKKEYDESDICTAIAPYWIGAEGEVVFLPEVIVVSPNIPLQRIPWTDENGNIITDGNGNDIEFSLIIRGIIPVPKDFSDSFEEEPTIEQLREKAISFIDNNEKWVPDENVTVNFVALWQTPEYENVAPLQRLSLCDTVSIFYPELGIISENQKVIKVVYDVLLERYSEMELGERQASYSEAITDGMVTESVLKTSLNRTSNSIQRILEGEVQHATELITGGLGGYLVIKLNANEQPEELLIMDTPDIETAVNVWRFNSGGLGHSHSGYNGPYNDVALTMDGRINATMISTGILNANLIRAGYLQDANGNNYWNLETGEFRLAALSGYATTDSVASTVVATDVQYGNSSSENTAPTSWTTNANWEKGKYLWTRTKMTLKDGTIEYSEARRMVGVSGLGVSSVEEQYYLSTSSSSQSGGSWSSAQPTWVKGRYYWTRSKITWSDGSTSYTTPALASGLTSGNQSTNDLSTSLNQQEIFNRLTNNGQTQGIYLSKGKLYINGTYIKTGAIDASLITTGTMLANRILGGTLKLGGKDNGNGVLEVYNASGTKIGAFNKDGIAINSGTIIGPIIASQVSSYLESVSVKKYTSLSDGKFSIRWSSYNKGYEDSSELCYITIGRIDGVHYAQNPNYSMAFVNSDPGTAGSNLFSWYGFRESSSSVVRRAATIESRYISSTESRFIASINGELMVRNGLRWAYSSDWDTRQYNNNSVSNYGLETYWLGTTPGGTKSVGSFYIEGSLTATETKSRVVDADQYGERLLYCYETPSPLFGDVGEGQISEDGMCFVWLDPVLAQAITTDRYQVFLQKYGEGDAYVSERKPGYFIVKGTPGLDFGWELKAKQADFDQKRLDKIDSFGMGQQTDYGAEAASYIIELEKGRLSA